MCLPSYFWAIFFSVSLEYTNPRNRIICRRFNCDTPIFAKHTLSSSAKNAKYGVHIALDELNRTIAEQQGVTVADLALKGPDGKTVQPESSPVTEPAVDPVATYTEAPAQDGVLTHEALAAQYRSQADALFKEAKALREQAEDLVPTKKKTTTKKKETSEA